MTYFVRAAGAVLATFAVGTGAAHADAPLGSQPLPFDRISTSVKDTPVLDRPHPDFAPVGESVGEFIIYPELGLAETYDDNLFATHSNPVADERTTLTPGLLIKSRWAQGLLQLDARGDIERYFDRPNEAVNNGVVNLTGRYDGPDYFVFGGEGEFAHLTESRASTLSPRDVVKPIQFDQAHLQARVGKDFERLKLALTGDIYQTTYQDGRTPAGAAVIEKIFDTREGFLDGSAAYVVNPDVAVVAHLIGNERRFINADVANGANAPVNRDSSGAEATVGVNLSLTHLIRAELLGGYLNQTYADRRVYRPVSGPSAHVKLVYLATNLTTLSLSIDRKINDSQDPVASSFLSTTAHLQIDHELYRNIILSAGAKYDEDRYSGISRRDVTWDGQVSAAYLLDRHFSLKFYFEDIVVASGGVAHIPSYDVRQVSFALVARY